MPLDAKSKQKAWLAAGAAALLLLLMGGLWWVTRDDSEPRPTGTRPAQIATSRPARRAPAPVGAIKYLNDLNGGNWSVTNGNAFMHANTSGSYLYLSMIGGLSSKQTSLLSARAAALKGRDDPNLALTSSQIEQLESIRFTNYMDTPANKTVMSEVWAEYQGTLADKKDDAPAIKAAEKKVMDALGKVTETSLEPTRLSYVEGAKIIESTLTAQQIKVLTPAHKTWTINPAK